MSSWASVDTQLTVENARLLARIAAPAKLCAVVKSNAYGHGISRVARALEEAGIPGLRLGVFTAAEARAIRDAGVATPVLVLGPVADDEIDAVAEMDVQCPVLQADDVERYAGGSLAVHVKVDTGLSRFGVRPGHAAATVERCLAAGLSVAGLYSHLSNAEDLDADFTQTQLNELLNASPGLPAGAVRHIAASAAAMLWPQTRLDMVRCGIALYGRWPSDEVRRAAGRTIALKPALRWFTSVVAVRDVAEGDSIGYGRAYVAPRPSTVAILGIGYADGLPRSAGGRLSVAIEGQRLPLVGRICMNACMADATDLRRTPVPGDVAEIDIDEAAMAAGTINYEILAGIPGSVERRYS